MAIEMIPIKCKQCGADLTVEKDREMLFCQYCGNKIWIRTEESADVIKAKTDQMVKKHKIEMDNKQLEGNQEKSKIKYLLIMFIGLIIWFSLIFLVFGILL